MESEVYRGYSVWGHAILHQEGALQSQGFAASGTITMSGRLVEASGILGYFHTEEEAQHAGLDWARAWIDSHG